MRVINDDLFQSITNQFQIGESRRPTQYVMVRNRFWGKTKPEHSHFDIEWARLPNVLSIDIDETTESPAKTFTIVLENKDGLFSPDYSKGKRPIGFVWRGVGDSAWFRQLYPNTELQIHLGYGDDIRKMLTGYIDNVRINAQEQTITITGRSKYKRAITNTIFPPKGREYFIERTNINIYHAVKALLETAGLEVTGSPVNVPGTNTLYETGVKLGKRGQAFDEVVREVVNSLFHTLTENSHGVIKFQQLPKYSRSDPADFIVDDYLHIKELEYEMDDTELYGRILVTCGEAKSAFTSSYIEQDILLGQRREVELDVPWANSPAKRHLAARAYITQMLYKWRRLSIAIPANPAIELWDIVGIREKISTTTQTYHLRGIRTSFSTSGFFQILEASSNIGFAPQKMPPPPSDLPMITRKAGAGYFTVSGSAGDRVALIINGQRSKDIKLGESVNVPANLKVGSNVIITEGVSAGPKDGLSANLRFTDSTGVTTMVQTINYPRTEVDEPTGFYKVRPRSTWVIEGVT
ncbi:hypothetical protein [Bacillus sp. FJAT-52991]|uniref:Uncharacterized protein n=1 Tax=Bacillus kandeliae TaxID=3129297 RepID=A0ABZ2N3A2_9BACI